MFCPKCGTKNPDNGQYCRKCGTDLGNVSKAMSGKLSSNNKLEKQKNKKSGWESAIGSLSMGVAFITVSLILGVSNMGRGWWFWMLIPAFAMLGTGISKIITIKQDEKQVIPLDLPDNTNQVSTKEKEALPPKQTEFVSEMPDGRYETGDLVPPSVVENTTRHLEMDKESETMTLPKNKL